MHFWRYEIVSFPEEFYFVILDSEFSDFYTYFNLFLSITDFSTVLDLIFLKILCMHHVFPATDHASALT